VFLNEHGLTVDAPSGYVQQRPEVSIRNKAWDRVAKFGSELGIGAASRSRIEVKQNDDGDEDTAAQILSITAGGSQS
jgi:P27 family predicted phage terminase small subunit